MNNLDYVPDSIYMICGHLNRSEYCDICSNEATTTIYPGTVKGSERGTMFCPFGKKDSMNKSIFADQESIKIDQTTKWGRVPQMPPRPLSLIGLDWRTS